MSFLVKKPVGFRLVTNFAELVKYAKVPPTRLPTTEDVIQQVGRWKYVISTDLTQAYWQIPLERNSSKYCAVFTPFKGLRVWLVAVMGCPGAEAYLDEVMSRVLGELITRGIVVKIADDLYVGANTISELYNNWREVLLKMRCNGLTMLMALTNEE